MDHDPNTNWFSSSNFQSNSSTQMPNVRQNNPYPIWSESQNFATNLGMNSFSETDNIRPNIPYPNWPITPNTPINPMCAPGAAYHQGYPPYGYYPYGFPPPGYPTQASNSSKRNNTDGTSTDRDDGTLSSEKISSFQPQFSPQGLDSIQLTFEEEDADDNQAKPTRSKKEGYSSIENELIVKCWIDTGTDSIIGNDQKLAQMWERIAEKFNKNRPASTSSREWGKLKSHFYTIQKQTRWFCDCYNRIAKEWGSGKNDVDIIEMAQEEYKQRHNKFCFKHIGMWGILRKCPKFTNIDGDVSSKKKMKISESGAYTSSSANEDDSTDQIRPIGQKLAKRNVKGKEKSVQTELIKEATEALEVKNERATRYIDIEEYKILMKDEDKIKPEKRAIHKKMLDKIKKKWAL